ncbi:hypothetical protein GJ629_12535 [Halapricum sp. CBA1109]|uniref:DUF7537 family lipoprotein n=1 Tax=Halapricum sp. CBA1109 TaxID=2668068 RepID=UPI0012F91E83|nr:hypothetical protein [Halapricum sp. CBA1109]MUV90623.1 hypothetical protein [Halapricum sp. CBA1109]
MRKLAAIMFAFMIVLAGCSGGGTTATPTDADGGDAPDDEGEMDATPTPDGDDGTDGDESDDGTDTDQPDLRETLRNTGSGGPLENATQVEFTLYNGTQQIDVLIRNDTSADRELIRLTRANGDTTTLYSTGDYAALRNTTTGQIRYGEPDGRIGTGLSFGASILIFGGLSYAGAVEWEAAGTTSVGGQDAAVFEADSLNRTAFENPDEGLNYGFEPDDVQSVDGRFVVTSEGGIRSISVDIVTGAGTFGTEISLTYEDVSVTKPDWVDESQAS